jgi:hypothetical protein
VNPAGNVDLILGQCASVFPNSIYEMSGWVRLETAGLQLQALRACQLFTSGDCTGGGLPPQVFFSTVGTPGVWQPFLDVVPVPPGQQSALCRLVLRNAQALPYTAHADDLSLDGITVNVIFTDGFESGDSSAWSTAVP